MRPRVGVTGSDRGSLPSWYFIALGVWLAGGRPVRLTPKSLSLQPTAKTLSRFDGFVLSGGADVDPNLYGQSLAEPTREHFNRRRARRWAYRHPLLLVEGLIVYLVRLVSSTTLVGMDLERDSMEFQCLQESAIRGVPVLGICRGAQILNVFYGGTLHQHLHSFYVERPHVRTVLPMKSVKIVAGSRLERIFEKRSCRVNSLHNQAADKLGRGLQIAALDGATGVIQAIEHTGSVLRVGVQWHPEYLLILREHFRLFRELVSAAKKTRPVPEAQIRSAVRQKTQAAAAPPDALAETLRSRPVWQA